MNCSELDQMLCPYLDGEFGPDERLELEGHLATCPACARKVHQESAFRSAFRARAREAAVVPLPDGLRDRVQAQIQAEERRARVRTVIPYAAAAALLAATGGGWAVLRTPARAGFLADAADRYARDLPVEVQVGDPVKLEHWFDGKLDHHFRVPHLSNAHVEGARLSNVKDREAAYITYEVEWPGHAPRRVGVFVFPDQHDDLEAEPFPRVEVIRAQRGYNVALWRENEIVYQLVTDLDEADIRRMLSAADEDALGASPHRPTVPYQQAGLRQ